MSGYNLKEILATHEELAKLSAAASFDYFMTMSKGLNRDTVRCLDLCRAIKDQLVEGKSETAQLTEDLDFWYRTLLRAFVTEVEGMLFVMRRITVWSNERGEIELSTAEAVLIREQEFFVNITRKRIEERDRGNRLLENFFLTFSLFPKVFRSGFQVDYGNHGWEMFQRVVKVRNSITHPKNLGDLVLHPNMYNVVLDAFSWFHDCIHKLLEQADREFLVRSHAETSLNPKFQEILRRVSEGEELKPGPPNPGHQADG